MKGGFYKLYGIDAIVRIFSHFAFIYLTFWALQSLRVENLFKKGQQYYKQIRLIYVLFSIFIGYTVSNFFMEVMFLTRDLFQGFLS
ncbi:MAG: DUF1146 family protein [Vagococcus sp.]|uniref:DUF1146 family protein n=1 Tax=Vagococcus sp. TaxID=1933889 RepID=UPI002FCC533D